MILTLGFAVGRMLHLKRTCPKCKRHQVVPHEKKHQTVRCKYCKTDILPKKIKLE